MALRLLGRSHLPCGCCTDEDLDLCSVVVDDDMQDIYFEVAMMFSSGSAAKHLENLVVLCQV